LFLTHRIRRAMIPVQEAATPCAKSGAKDASMMIDRRILLAAASSLVLAPAFADEGGLVLICTYTQGGSPTPPLFEAIFAEVGGMVGRQMG
jgi:hypothetical protein